MFSRGETESSSMSECMYTHVNIAYPGVNFINVLHAQYSYKILMPKITKPNVFREKMLNSLSYEKGGQKMLMKLTTGRVPPLDDKFS